MTTINTSPDADKAKKEGGLSLADSLSRGNSNLGDSLRSISAARIKETDKNQDQEQDSIELSIEAKRKLAQEEEAQGKPLDGDLLRAKLAIDAWRRYFLTGSHF